MWIPGCNHVPLPTPSLHQVFLIPPFPAGVVIGAVHLPDLCCMSTYMSWLQVYVCTDMFTVAAL